MSTNGHANDKMSRRRRIIRSFEAKSLHNRNFGEKLADTITASTGNIAFLLLNVYWFSIWIVLNVNVIPGVVPFDPFPFGLLTMIVSLEAIILSVFVLLSQNRAAHIDSLRDELHLQVNLIAEEEITKVLEILADMRAKMGIKREDPELSRMLERIDTSYIERTLQKQVDTGTANILKIITQTSHQDKSLREPQDKQEKEVEKK